MQNNENKTKEELIKIIEQLEKKVEDLSSMQSYPVQERFREKYSTRILDALPDMLTVFDHDANIIELASSPSTNHVEGINADNITHSNVKDILPPEAYESVRQNMDRVILTGESSTSRHDLMLFFAQQFGYKTNAIRTNRFSISSEFADSRHNIP